MTRQNRVYESIVDLIARPDNPTPMVKISEKVNPNKDFSIYLKLERYNPFGSVKDRIALSMLEGLEIEQGKSLVEPSSGNTGIALAWVAAARGYKLVLTMLESMTVERRRILELFDVELVLTPAEEGMTGAVNKAKEIIEKTDGTFMPQQFENPANPQIHRETTAEEIWNDTDGQIDIFVAGIGTGGTITGVGEVLKSRKPSVKIIAVEPSASPVLSGGRACPHMIQGIGAGFVPDVLNMEVVDDIVQIGNKEAFNMAKRLAKEEGILSGISSGAAVAAAVKIAKRKANANKLVVVVLPDTGERYLSTELFY
ncbi:MAG: cysteine synthase A [Planctomycetota bacterium]